MLDGDTLYIPHLLSNTIQPTLHLANTVFPAVSVLPLGRQGSFKLDLAFIDRPVNGPEALAIWHRGRFLAAVNSRSNDLTVIDLEDRLLEAHIPVGRFPVGMVIEPDGERAYVYNAHDHTISVVSLGALREIERWPVDEEVLPANLARGRDIFHDADSLNMTLNQWVSCSNCHPDGHSDGRVWQLPGKPRLRTKDLRGLLATLPAGWNATQDEMQDEEIFIRNFHLGLGLSEKEPHAALGPPNAGLSADLDALSEYVYSLAVTPSPNLIDGRLSQPAERGRTLFFSSQLGCVGCHPPPSFTVSRLADNPRYEGLLAPELDPVPPVDVPSLLGLWRQPRLLHDGRAERPLEVFTHWNQQDRHGRTSHLSEAELLDLEAFLLSLPYATVPPQPAAPRTEKEGSE